MSKKYTIYCFPILFWIICYFGFSFDGLYGQDAYEYLRFTESLVHYYKTGGNPGDYFWGVYYPLIGSLLSIFIGNTTLALQLISLISLLISTFYLIKIIELIYHETPDSLIIFLCFSISPIILTHSILIMSDLLTCALLLISIYHLLNYLENTKKSSIFIGISFCLITILTRYAAIVILFPIALAFVLKIVKNKHFSLLLLTLPIIAVISLPHIAIKSHNSIQFLSHSWLQNWNILNLFESNFSTIDGESRNNFINAIYICFQLVHPAFFVFGILVFSLILLKQKIKTQPHQRLLILSILLYSFFLGGIPFQNKRFLIQSFPLLIICVYPYLESIYFKIKHKKTLFCFVFIIQMFFTIYVGKQYFDRNYIEKTISNEMKKYENKTLYTFDMDIALKGRGLQFNYKNLYLKQYGSFQKNAFVLVNEKNIEQQWKGKTPYSNWKKIKNKCVLKQLKQFNADWKLYIITKSSK